MVVAAVVGKNVKSTTAIAKGRSSDHDALARHIAAGSRNSIRHQLKGICRAERVSIDSHDPVFVSAHHERKLRPSLTDVEFVRSEGNPDIRPKTSDMNVQLVLRSALR
jgi:hypothetical protein